MPYKHDIVFFIKKFRTLDPPTHSFFVVGHLPSGKETDTATMLGLKKYGRINFTLGILVNRDQNAAKCRRAQAVAVTLVSVGPTSQRKIYPHIFFQPQRASMVAIFGC